MKEITIFIIVFSCLAIVFGWFVYEIIENNISLNCLKEIATEYCEDNEMEFQKNNFLSFKCLDNRQIEEFYFTEKEREKC